MLLTDRIYQNMFERILRGEFLPGQKFLTEQEGMDFYHASRITIRRAFSMLETNGVIIRKQKVGSIVNTAFAASPGKINRIGAVVPLGNHFIRNFLNTLCSEAAERDIIIVLEPAATGHAQNEALIRLVLHGIQDIVIWGIDRNLDLDLCLRLRILGINLTFFDQIIPGNIADYVGLDNHAAITVLLDRAAAEGVKNIFYYDPDKLDVDTNFERCSSCRDECAKRNWNFSSALPMPQKFPPDSAIVAVNDEAAMQVINCGIPVYSIDGLDSCRRQGVVSYRQPMNEFAKICFDSLCKQRKLSGKWRAHQYRLISQDPFA